MLDGSRILRELWGSNELMPIYDNADSVSGIIYNGVSYYFQKNLQGDVIELVDEEAEVVARYTYDAWGKVTGVRDKNGNAITDTAHIAHVNPFRYRGYYFDVEIGLYYLQSRYYDPVVGRFVNADEPEYVSIDDTILSCNLFAYCKNSCVNTEDPTGHGPFLAIGVQFVANIGRITVGVEALWSTSNGKFYLFFFIGGAKSFNSKKLTNAENTIIESIKKVIKSVKNFSISNFSLFKKFNISVSFIAVLGNKKASFPKHYCGWFTGLSLTICHITVSGAIASDGITTIGSFALGVCSSKANIGFSQTFYFQLTGDNAWLNSLNALKNGIGKRLEMLKLFACFI